MLISLLLLMIIAAGGFAVTYLIDDDAPFMWRLAAGNVIGAAVFGSLGFGLALAFGFNPGVAVAAAILTLAPLLLFYRSDYRKNFRHDWTLAKGRLQGTNTRKFLRFAYYGFFFLLFFFFFDRSMLASEAGIFTGGIAKSGRSAVSSRCDLRLY